VSDARDRVDGRESDAAGRFAVLLYQEPATFFGALLVEAELGDNPLGVSRAPQPQKGLDGPVVRKGRQEAGVVGRRPAERDHRSAPAKRQAPEFQARSRSEGTYARGTLGG
jgi:hypothetical protein